MFVHRHFATRLRALISLNARQASSAARTCGRSAKQRARAAAAQLRQFAFDKGPHARAHKLRRQQTHIRGSANKRG